MFFFENIYYSYYYHFLYNKKYYEAIEILCFARLLESVLKIILNYLLIIRDLFTMETPFVTYLSYYRA